MQTTILLSWLLSVQSFDLKDAITARLRFHKGNIYSEDEHAAEGSSHSSSSLKTKDSGSWTLPKIGVGFRLYVLGGKKQKDGPHKKPKAKKYPKKMVISHPPSSSHFSHHHQVYSPEEETTMNSYGGLNQRFPMMSHQHTGGNNAPLFPYRDEHEQPSTNGFGGSDQSFDFPVKGNFQPELHSGQEEQHQSYRFPEDVHTKFVAHSPGSHLRSPGSYADVIDSLKHTHGFREERMPGYHEVNHNVAADTDNDERTTADHSPINGHHGINYVASGSHNGLLMSTEQQQIQGMTEGSHGGQFIMNSIPQFKPFPAVYQSFQTKPMIQRYPSQISYYTVDEDSLGHDEGIRQLHHSPAEQVPMVEQESSASAMSMYTPSQRSHTAPILQKLSGDDKLLKTLKLVLDIARATKQENTSNNNASNKKPSMLIRNPNSLRNFKRSADKRSSSVVGEIDLEPQPQPTIKTSESKDISDSLEGDLNKLIVALEDRSKSRNSDNINATS